MLLLLFRGVVVHGHKPKLLSRFPGNTAALNLTVTKLGTFSPVELHKYMTSQPGAQRLGVGYGPSLRSTRGPQRQKAEPIQVHCQSTLQTAIPNTGRGGIASSTSSALPHLSKAESPAYCHQKATIFQYDHFQWPQQRRQISVSTAVREKNSAVAAPQACAEEGVLVEYKKDQKSGLALITERDGKRNWKAIDIRGHVHSLRPQQIAYILPGKDYREPDLLEIHKAAESQAMDTSIMQDAWELLKGEKNTFMDVVQMAQLLFGNDSAACCYASHRLLNEDRTYFKQAGRMPPVFAARQDKEVVAILARDEAEKQRIEQRTLQRQAREAAFRAALTKPYGEKPGEDEWLGGPWAANIRTIQAYALQETSSDTLTVPAEILEIVQPFARGAAHPPAAAELLKQLGVWSPNQYVPLLRMDLTNKFDPQVLTEADALLAAPPPDPDVHHRVDLTHLPVWAIDSAETTEVDDGISIERLADGTEKLWVHVADPSRWVAMGSKLDEEAARRSITMYMPTGAVFMFPKSVSEGLFSFRDGAICPAMSIWMELDEDGSLANCGILCSNIKPTRLTYDAVCDRLEADESNNADLRRLYEVARLRQQWRDSQGAVVVNTIDSEISLTDLMSPYPTIYFKMYGEETTANRLVTELMVLANEAVGSIGALNKIPLPYRSQAEAVPFTPEDLQNVPEGICRSYLRRSRMTRSVFTVSAPLPHHGLGVPAYVQSTSPIRRYSDLLVHWQLKAHIRGEEMPLTVDSLNDTMTEVALKTRQAKVFQIDATRYWQAVHFQRERLANPSKQYEALLVSWLKQEAGAGFVVLQESGLNVRVILSRPYPLGSKVLVTCTRADPFTSQVDFIEAESSTQLKEIQEEDDLGSVEIAMTATE